MSHFDASNDMWADPTLKLKPRQLKDVKKDEVRFVQEFDRVAKPAARHRVNIALKKTPEEYLPGRSPDFYPDQYVVAPTAGAAVEAVKEHLKLKLTSNLYEFSTLTLDD